MREAVQERCSGCTKPNRNPASVLIRESGSRTMTDKGGTHVLVYDRQYQNLDEHGVRDDTTSAAP